MKRLVAVSHPPSRELAARTASKPHCRYSALVASVVVVLLAAAAGRLGASTDADRRAVSALDKEYKEAVKRNDAATMNRILADDFVLVTGSGRHIREQTCSKMPVEEMSISGTTKKSRPFVCGAIRRWSPPNFGRNI